MRWSRRAFRQGYDRHLPVDAPISGTFSLPPVAASLDFGSSESIESAGAGDWEDVAAEVGLDAPMPARSRIRAKEPDTESGMRALSHVKMMLLVSDRGVVVGYDPKTFWNEKARRATDPLAAVCHANPVDNRNIDRVQRRLVGRALARVDHAMPLAGKSVLDYGCGVGRFVALFESLGCNYSGVDIAEEMVAIALRQKPGRDFKVLENGRIPHDDATFDLAISIAVIHHNAYEPQERIVNEILRVLRPTGYAVLFEAIGEPNPQAGIEFARPLEDWLAMFRKRGLSCVYHDGARYFLTRKAWGRWHRLMGETPSSISTPGWLDAVGAWIDPITGSLLPRSHQNRAVMVFERGRAERQRR